MPGATLPTNSIYCNNLTKSILRVDPSLTRGGSSSYADYAIAVGKSSNGRTRGSGPRDRGSNPCFPAKKRLIPFRSSLNSRGRFRAAFSIGALGERPGARPSPVRRDARPRCSPESLRPEARWRRFEVPETPLESDPNAPAFRRDPLRPGVSLHPTGKPVRVWVRANLRGSHPARYVPA